MTNEENLSPKGEEKIKNIINEFFIKSGLSNFGITIAESTQDDLLNVSLSTNEAGFLIGEKGRNISVFEIILRLIIKKYLGRNVILHLDVNNYRNLREESLRELAKKAAHRARFYKKEVSLEAMSAYDRRIIHMELAIHPDIKTESVGEGENRRVVVKYIN